MMLMIEQNVRAITNNPQAMSFSRNASPSLPLTSSISLVAGTEPITTMVKADANSLTTLSVGLSLVSKASSSYSTTPSNSTTASNSTTSSSSFSTTPGSFSTAPSSFSTAPSTSSTAPSSLSTAPSSSSTAPSSSSTAPSSSSTAPSSSSTNLQHSERWKRLYDRKMLNVEWMSTLPKIEQFVTPMLVLGDGVYGTVCSGVMKEQESVVTKEQENKQLALSSVAVKILKPTEMTRDRMRWECAITSLLKHDNTIRLLDMCIDEKKNRVCMVMEIADTDLDYALRMGWKPTEKECCFVIQGILRGLVHLEEQKIVHRDIKPSNILFSNGIPKICDFGLATTYSLQSDGYANNHVVTDCYKAPELLVEPFHHGPGVDIWSTGCLLVKMLLHHQELIDLQPFHHVHGTKENRDYYRSDLVAFLKDRISTISPHRSDALTRANLLKVRLMSVYPGPSSELFDFLSLCLTPSLWKRPNAKELLDHYWFSSFKNQHHQILSITSLPVRESHQKVQSFTNL
jgi:serine/threonine protein kinase